MRASYRWLCELAGVDATAEVVAERLTSLGFEVEKLTACGDGVAAVQVVEVRRTMPHPQRDKLQLVEVYDGAVERSVVCGASNVPAAGGRVLLAGVGVTLASGKTLEAREVGGVLSAGMLCSEAELGLGDDATGLCVLGAADVGKAGDRLAAILPLEDTVLELGITPNRPDALGHIGLARELALSFGKTLALPKIAASSNPASSHPNGAVPIEVRIEAAARCPRYTAAALREVRVAPSPLALRYRLHTLGIRPIHNVVDVTNWILMLWGQPLHAFDASKLRGGRIVVRHAKSSETLRTLDGVERQLRTDDLLIADAERGVALAGIIGGANSEIDAHSRDVLIECAYFEPRGIRRTARAAGLSTDASHRFERGADPGVLRLALAHAVAEIQRLAGGVVTGEVVDVVAQELPPHRVALDYPAVEATLGVDIRPAEGRRILEGLGCRIVAAEALAASVDGSPDSETARRWQVEVPTWRPDLQRGIDLIEEIVRVYGYDRIPVRLPRLRPAVEAPAPLPGLLDRLRLGAANLGLREAVNYSFVSPRLLEQCGVGPAAVHLLNPLSEEQSVMRPSLLPGLLTTARLAHRHQVEAVQLFEVGHTFQAAASNAALPDERWELGVLLSGPFGRWLRQRDATADAVYELKGLVESLVAQVLGGLPEVALPTEAELGVPPFASLHPRKSVALIVDGIRLGVLGAVHPDVLAALDFARAEDVAYAQLSVAALLEVAARRGTRQAQSLPRFPSVSRDVTLQLSHQVPAAEVARALRQATDGLCESVELVDVYDMESASRNHGEDGKIGVGLVNLTFRLLYRDPQETLTDLRVDKVHAEVLRTVQQRFAVPRQ